MTAALFNVTNTDLTAVERVLADRDVETELAAQAFIFVKEDVEAKEAAERKAKEVAEAETAEYNAAQAAFEHRRIQYEQKKQEHAEAAALAEIERQTALAAENEAAAKELVGLRRRCFPLPQTHTAAPGPSPGTSSGEI